MNNGELTNGPAAEVADFLNSSGSITQDDLVAALVNALSRISHLENENKRQGKRTPATDCGQPNHL